jgi:hypothetical protein
MSVVQSVEAVATWISHTRLSWAVAGGYPWVWPLCETLHFIGLCLLLGVAGGLDLRILGVAKGCSIAPLQRLIPVAIAGFGINLVTGALFFVGAPFQYVHNYPFWLKVASLFVAGVNVAAYKWLGLEKAVDAVGPNEDAPRAAKIVASVSLFSWLSVVYWGRMLPFLGTAF